jgi:O-6-methylguanine DNA methyltransferase
LHGTHFEQGVKLDSGSIINQVIPMYTAHIIETSLGDVEITLDSTRLTRAHFVDKPSRIQAVHSSTSSRIGQKLNGYLAGETQVLDVVCVEQGTAFQLKVWAALRQIPFGGTWTYSYLAQHIGRPKAVRAVASAVAQNPCLVFTPCHRVVRKDGAIGGYAGGVGRKRALLRLEGVVFKG